MVSRAAARRPLRGPGPLGGARRLAIDGGPPSARAAQPARAGGLRAARRVRLRLPRGRVGGGALGGACRQLAVRARHHMGTGRPRFAADRREREELAARFFDAFGTATSTALGSCSPLAFRWSGMVAVRPQRWPGASWALWKDRYRCSPQSSPGSSGLDMTLEPREVNGQPGAIFRDRDSKVLLTLTLDVLDGQIQTIRSVSNPDKLGHLGPVGRRLGGRPRGEPGLSPVHGLTGRADWS